MILIDGAPEIPGISRREVTEIITRAINAGGTISESDAARFTVAELCELEAIITTELEQQNGHEHTMPTRI